MENSLPINTWQIKAILEFQIFSGTFNRLTNRQYCRPKIGKNWFKVKSQYQPWHKSYKITKTSLNNCVVYSNRYDLQLESLSGPMVFGGLGRLRMTSLASCDLLTMTSFNLTAVCMRRTLEESFLCVAKKNKGIES